LVRFIRRRAPPSQPRIVLADGLLLTPPMISGTQIRAARVLLIWTRANTTAVLKR
jgi:hypothetical protein